MKICTSSVRRPMTFSVCATLASGATWTVVEGLGRAQVQGKLAGMRADLAAHNKKEVEAGRPALRVSYGVRPC